MPIDLTPAERQALIDLVIAAPGSTTVLIDALACSMAIREANSTWGGLMIAALMRNGVSRREIARQLTVRLGREDDPINESTIRRWGLPPAQAAADYAPEPGEDA